MSTVAVARSASTELDTGWDEARWVRILDRIEHRRTDVGLRFWGPPLWLEVTMVGPDSDLWPTVSDEPASWDWQSSAPCLEAAALEADGADDERLLVVVGRYTIENLILNAVHEIGEWFRIDGRRPFPAHGFTAGAAAAARADADQGNGGVTVELAFGAEAIADAPRAEAREGQQDGRRLVRCLTESAAPSRFTYLPGTMVSYEPAGPVIERTSDDEATAGRRSTWSRATVAAAGAHRPDAETRIVRDVHRALVLYEADRICRAFHIDGRRPWAVADAGRALQSDPLRAAAEVLSVSIRYSDAPESGTLLSEQRPALRGSSRGRSG